DTWLDDVAHDSPCDTPWRVAANAWDFDIITIVDHATKSATEVPLQAFGLSDRRTQPSGNVARDVVATGGDHTCVGDRAVDKLNQIGGATAKVDHGDTDFLFVLAEHCFCARH